MNNGKRITAFFLVLLGLIFLSSGLFYRAAKKTQDPSLLRRNAAFMDLEKEPRESIDLLVLGDSESYTSISPMQVYNETGITTYVAGQSGQNMAEMYHMFETAMKTQTPKAIMIETHALIHSKGSAYDLQNMGTELAQTCFPVFSYHNLWKGRLAGESARVSAWKGFRVKSGVRACLDTKKYMKPTDHIRMVPSGNRAIFDKILKECKDKNIEVVLYSAPSPVNYSYANHNGIALLAQESGVPYLDLNLETADIGIDWLRDTMDAGDHLNISGAEKTTQYLIPFLQSLNLPDHRGQKAYAAWDHLAGKYDSQVAGMIRKIRGSNEKV